MVWATIVRPVVVFAALLAVFPASAQNVDGPPGYEQVRKMAVPVVSGDITDRPYRVVGHIQVGVRRATIFSHNPSQEKVYRELWERARKLNADAVIHAGYGEAHIAAWSWGSREAQGDAIKFLTDSEIAALQSTEGAEP